MINVISTIVRTKVLALETGTSGIGIFSQINNFSAIFFAFIPLGAMGFTRYLADRDSSDDKEEVNYLFWLMIKINIPIGIVAAIIIAFFSDQLSLMILASRKYYDLIILTSIALPFGILYSIFDIYFKSLRRIKNYAFFVSITSVASLAIYIPVQIYYGVFGAVLSNLLSCIISFAFVTFLLRRLNKLPESKRTRRINNTAVRNIMKIGLASMTMLGMQQGTFLYIRTLILERLSLHELGIYQSAFSISNNYFGLFFTIIATYSLPKLSTIKDNSIMIKEINDTLKLVLIIFVPAICVCYVFRSQLLNILYSSNFLDANNLLFYQLLGDFLKALSWIFGLWLLPSLKIKEWFLFDLIFYVNFLLFTSIFMTFMNLQAVSMSYFLAYIIHAIVNLFYIKYRISFYFLGNNMRFLIYSLAAVTLIFLISLYSHILSFFALPIILIFWFGMCFKRDDILEAVKLFKSFFEPRSA